MKTIKSFTLSLLFVSSFSAQTINDSTDLNIDDKNNEMETLFDKKFSVRGFISLNSGLSEIKGDNALMTGGGISMVLNHSLNIGFEGMGMVADIHSPNINSENTFNHIQFGYGGIKIEPVFNSYKKVHFTIPMLIAAGAVLETNFSVLDEIEYHEEHDYNYELERSDVVFVFQPGINAEVNLFKHFRLAGGVKYRFVNDVEITNLKNKDFEGISGNISLRFGWF